MAASTVAVPTAVRPMYSAAACERSRAAFEKGPRSFTSTTTERSLYVTMSFVPNGSVPDAADLVVSDPVQAGVMAVMAVSASAHFDIRRQQGRRY